MKPAPEDYDNLLLALESSMHGAEMVDFNINDGEITPENWRQTEGIYIYDGKGTDVKDKEGRTGYTLYLKDFDTKNSHVGQGVWNLKKTPVVYRSNFINTLWAYNQGMPMLDDLYLYGYQLWYFFDPSSIEVELNPNVFPEDQIEWMQVDALCGVRSSMRYNGTDSYLKALGIGKNEIQQRYEVRNI